MSRSATTPSHRPALQPLKSVTYTEVMSQHLRTNYDISQVLYRQSSDLQDVMILDTPSFGKVLVMDGQTQSAQFDERCYHEALVHPSVLISRELSSQIPLRVFIGGGGELATAREVLKHENVEVTMVDIDRSVVELAREHLPEWGGDQVLNDPRFHLVIDDAKAYMESDAKAISAGDKQPYDVIIFDICDPLEGGPAYQLYTKGMYETVRTCLRQDSGVFVTQAGPGGLMGHRECFTAIHNTIQQVFSVSSGYTIEVPSFTEPWAFCLAVNTDTLATEPEAVIADVDVALAGSLRSDAPPMHLLDDVMYRRMFLLPKPVRLSLASEKRVITVDNPVFLAEVAGHQS